jgi:hypothetical protein
MELLDFIQARLYLRIVILRMKNSREDIQQKHPNRIDLIEPLHTSECELSDVFNTIIKCENEINNRGRQLNNYERIILEQKARIKELENEVKFKNIEL